MHVPSWKMQQMTSEGKEPPCDGEEHPSDQISRTFHWTFCSTRGGGNRSRCHEENAGPTPSSRGHMHLLQ